MQAGKLNFRVILPTMLIGMLLFNIVFFARMFKRKCSPEQMNPHEEGSTGEEIRFSTQVRYNKDLFSNAATPIFCIFIGIGIYFTLSTALDFSVGKINMMHRTGTPYISNLTTCLLLDQKRVDTSVFYNRQLFSHMVFTPGVFYIFSSGARKHMLRILGYRENEAPVTIEMN